MLSRLTPHGCMVLVWGAVVAVWIFERVMHRP